MTGRPQRALSAAERETAAEMLAGGAALAAVARALGLDVRTLRRIRDAGGLDPLPANSGRDQAGRFAAGASGNPAGKPRGARHRTTLAAEALLQGEAEALTRKAVERALEGDVTALRLVLERVLPVRRGRPAPFHLPDQEGPAGIVAAVSAVARAVAAGELTAEEGQAVAAVLEAKRKSVELVEIEERLAALEASR